MLGRRRSIGASAFTVLLLLIAEWSLTEGLEFMSADLPSILFWDKAAYVGVVSVPVVSLIFVLYHTGHNRWLTTRTISLLFIIPGITLLLRWTDEIHHLIYSEYSLVTRYGLSLLQWTWGNGFYVDAAYSYILVLFGISLLVQQQFSRFHGQARRQSLILMLSILVPLAVSVVEVLNFVTYPVDLISLAFTFTGFGFFWAVFRFRLFELMPVAREAIFQGVSDGVLVLDESNHIADVNPAVEKIFGISATEVLGKSSDELFKSHRLNGQPLAQGSSEIALTIHGAQRYFDLGISSLRDKRGMLVGKIGVMRDITERKQMEDALRTSEARFRELTDLLPQIVFEIDEKGILTFFNRVGLSSTGYTEEEVRRGFDVFHAFPPEDARKAMEGMRRVLCGERVSPDEHTLLRKDGTSFPIMIHSSAIIRDGKPVGLRGIIVDMTERKEMEQRLLKAEHLAAIGETASMVAHDLRNPLQGITGATYLLRKESLTADERNEMLQLIDSSVEHAETTVRDLLDYSRKLNLACVETSPKDIIRNALHVAKVPDNIKVQDLSQTQPAIYVDPDRMKRVFINLIENAIDAMPGGGTLTISTSESNGHLGIAVSDTGTGISKEIMDNLWKPLQTTKAKGMGLGLPIVKRIVDAHGGDVSVETKFREGTTFTIRLPMKVQIVEQPAMSQAARITKNV